MRAKVWQVVTFAAEPFRGNPAFVVGLDEDLPPELLRALGTQFSGVTAVLGPNQGEALRLRFVTAAGTPSGCRSCRRGGGLDSSSRAGPRSR